MSKKLKWSFEKYKVALMGDELPGLRKVVKGFKPTDGYDLRHFNEWTPYQKRRVRDYYERVHLLSAQEKRIVFPRSKNNLNKLQEAFHGDVKSKMFKAVFVPYTTPKMPEGLKQPAPKISFPKEGIVIDAGPYQRVFIPFDHRKLARNPEREIDRAIEAMGEARLMFIQVGQFQTLRGRTGGLLKEQVLKYIEQYDGKKALPATSGNRGDDPAHHHWKKWLNGIVGYIFPKHVKPIDMAREIERGMVEAKQRRHEQDKRVARKQRQAKKK